MPAKKSASRAVKTEWKLPPGTQDLPATRGMLQLVRSELKAEVRSGFAKVEARFSGQDSKFSGLESRFSGLESRFSGLESQFESVRSEIARLGVLFEEQNANNRIVLEGLSGLWHRQEQYESKLTGEVERVVAATFARSRG